MQTWKRATLAMVPLAVLYACGGGGGGVATPPPNALFTCDDSLKTGFKFEETTVVAVKAFKKGDALSMSTPAAAATATAHADLCLVKLVVGPATLGPADAPSTSPGVGIQVWLPEESAWNERMVGVGGGGFIGGTHSDPEKIDTTYLSMGSRSDTHAIVHAERGYIGVENDKGHKQFNGSFAMTPEGKINLQGWANFNRANHLSAVRAKALALAYYGKEPQYAYFIGASSGGREALKIAQTYPNDYNGIVSSFPAINWTAFIASELYPQLVIQRDLGGQAPTFAQFETVERAAVQACGTVGGVNLGYVMDPSQCTYNPAKDLAVLCAADGGNNATPGCVSALQANVFNKFWYGQTSDGSAPDPAVDSGWAKQPSGVQRWYGTTRGTNLMLGKAPFTIATDQAALSLQDSAIADPTFLNASGNGKDGWKALSYADLGRVADRGIALQPEFANVDTNNPDLSAFKAAGGKLIMFHGLADELIMPQGSTNYYERVMAAQGSLTATQSFFKLYLVPGMGHGLESGSSQANAVVPVASYADYLSAVQRWVETGTAPGNFTGKRTAANSSTVAASAPICAYPTARSYVSGDPLQAASYSCK